jgi:putative nucleotidyltransferase with HDIG domain
MTRRSSMDLTKHLFHIATLTDLSEEITSHRPFHRTVKATLYMVLGTLSVSKGAVFQFEREASAFSPIASKGFELGKNNHLPITLTQVRRLIRRNRQIKLSSPPPGLKGFVQIVRNRLADMQAQYFIPLVTRKELIGAIVLGSKLSRRSYTQADFDILPVMSNSIAVAIHNHQMFLSLREKMQEIKQLYENMREIYYDTVKAFAVAIDTKDAFTKNHSLRVAKYAVAIAREMNFSQDDLEGIYIAGLLHDIGKIVIDKVILNKEQTLSDDEKGEIHLHPLIGSEIIQNIKFPWRNIADIIRHHHERGDGHGYPDGLSDADLSLAVKIITFADAFDAMTTDRPYRQRLSLEKTIDEICAYLNLQFDKKVTNVFFKILKQEISGELPEPQILPNLEIHFDPKIITQLLDALVYEIST